MDADATWYHSVVKSKEASYMEAGDTFETHTATFMYVINELGDKPVYMIVNIDNADVEFLTEDYTEFTEMWLEMKA